MVQVWAIKLVKTMKRCRFTIIVVALTFLLMGCRSPKYTALPPDPHWQQDAQILTAEKNSEGSGLVWQPFPDMTNPLHREIWKAHFKNDKVGTAFGAICNYYGVYLVTTTYDMDFRDSFFYDPKNHYVFEHAEDRASMFYKGNREATPTNVIKFVQQLAAANGQKSFVILNPNDIPHTAFSKDNQKLSFEEFLASKSIIVTPPTLMRANGDDYHRGYEAYNVFVYMPCGGQLFRYEVRCGQYLGETTRFLIGEDIGDAWYIE